jgi:geranylgeranyl reductase family protein
MYDLIIVGAGPAGSSAARVAAQRGLSTLLVEKEKIPRHKLCGGGLTAKVLGLLDFKLPEELIERTVKSARIHVGSEEYSFETNQPLVYMTSRAKFDAFLTEKAGEAGSEIIDETPVIKVETNDSYVEITTKKGRYRSKLLIGADGVGGPTRSTCLNSRWIPQQVAYAIESEVTVGERSVIDFIGNGRYFDLYFGVSTAGYGWIFPKDDHLTVGVGCRLSKLRDAHSLFDAFTKGIPALRNSDIPTPKAHLIPLGGAVKVPTVSNRVMLAGDSAGFAEPLLGEGIYFSILGAQIAARTAIRACQSSKYDVKFLRQYENEHAEMFGKDFDVAYRVACFSYLEQYDMARFARFFFSEKRVQECMIGLMDGTIRYRDAQMKLVWPYFKYRLAKLGMPFYS